MPNILTTERIHLGVAELLAGTPDPTLGVGVVALVGSLYLRSTGETYQKVSAGDTGWSKFLASLAWHNVKDYGAAGDNITDDSAAIQAAIDACHSAGGGRVYFPIGKYFTSVAISLNGKRAVQLQGAGPNSVIRTSAGQSLVGDATTLECRVSELKLEGAGAVFTGSQNLGLFEVNVGNCTGPGIKLDGTFKFWVKDCTITASTYGVELTGAWTHGWVVNNLIFDCGASEFRISGVAATGAKGLSFASNILKHSAAGANPLAVDIIGNPASAIAQLSAVGNVLVGGGWNAQYFKHSVTRNNIITSGVYASSEATLTLTNMALSVASENIVSRALGAGAGVVLEVTGATQSRVAKNLIFQELAASDIALIDSSSQSSYGNNLLRNVHASGPSGVGYGVVVRGGATGTSDTLMEGNAISTAAGTYKALVKLEANAAGNVSDTLLTGTLGSGAQYIAEFAKTGAGTISGKLGFMANGANTTIGDYLETGVTLFPVIGMNASPFGAQLISGTGSPEGVVTSRIGSLYLNRSGGAGTSMYVKESGTAAVGWVPYLNTAPIYFGAANAGTVATALYLGPGFLETAAQATELAIPITKDGFLRNLRVRHGATAGVGAAVNTFTIMVNGVASTLTCVTANTGTNSAGSDITHTVAVVAGDVISLRLTKSVAVTSGQGPLTASLELT